MNSVLHMTAVLHINCRLVSNLFEIKTCMEVSNKTFFEPYMHKKPKEESSVSPFQTFCVVPETSHQKQFHLPRKKSYGNKCTCRSKKTCFCLVVSCKHAKKPCSGTLASGSHSRQNGFGKFFIVNARLGPVHFIHPSMLLTFAPTKLLCEQITETSRRTAEN